MSPLYPQPPCTTSRHLPALCAVRSPFLSRTSFPYPCPPHCIPPLHPRSASALHRPHLRHPRHRPGDQPVPRRRQPATLHLTIRLPILLTPVRLLQMRRPRLCRRYPHRPCPARRQRCFRPPPPATGTQIWALPYPSVLPRSGFQRFKAALGVQLWMLRMVVLVRLVRVLLPGRVLCAVCRVLRAAWIGVVVVVQVQVQVVHRVGVGVGVAELVVWVRLQ